MAGYQRPASCRECGGAAWCVVWLAIDWVGENGKFRATCFNFGKVFAFEMALRLPWVHLNGFNPSVAVRSKKYHSR